MKKLSCREVEIINHIASGFTAKEIGKKIGLEHRTIETYLTNIKKKLGAKNSAHAIYLVCKMSAII